MNAEIVSSLLTQEVPAGTTETPYAAAVPVDHLDYGYIEKCTDVKYLGKILRVLRSGDEGIYPHLIEFCESRLERLDPRSRALRKDNPPATAACLSGDEWSQITDELKKWERDAKMSETELKQQSLFHDLENDNVPPVRGSSCSITLKQNAVSNGQKKTSQKKVLPRNYIEWDQYDVDRECDKIDGNVTKKDPPAIINSRYLKIRSKMNTTALTEQEKVLVANREKVKGNEAFKANDYEEAVVYYSRSLSVVPTVAGYNNRAQSEINLQHWHNALNDCQKALEMEPGNMKALLRRATVLKQQGNYQMAAEDLRSVLQAEPQNITATKLLVEVDKKLNQCQPEKERKSKKIVIQEVENEQGEDQRGMDSPEDLCVLYSNRAACYLKDGNSSECIQDCTRSLELQPFSLKPLLRRAMAYETMERYRQAYVDYKTVLQIDISVQAAHDSVNRITRLLIEQDGEQWREKLPEIPLVPLSAQQHRREEPPSAEVLQARAEKAKHHAARKAEVCFNSLKQEGNEFVKKGQFQEAVRTYSECLKLKPEECPIYTNRALCFLKLDMFAEAKQDCDSALRLEPANKKAFYRRALAHKGLKDYLACSSDLQEVLQQDPNVAEAEKELEEVTLLLRQSLAQGSPSNPRRTVPITEVEGTEEEDWQAAEPDRTKAAETETEEPSTTSTSTPAPPENQCRGGGGGRGEEEAITINLQPSNSYEFNQSLNAARAQSNLPACAELLSCVPPETLPVYLSNQLDGHTVSFIMQALDTQLLQKDPNLVYQHLTHLHTADRFSVVVMLLEKSERGQMTRLFDRLSAVDSDTFSKNDVQNLANKYI
ncbi:sperm-associated antigen 1 isoform X2 [Coregonus clupeaformis]|uniref:sperm-associated antigen 1 isoform X2 n=1 Tax=Coregonus clupeaformis TaxID=59861 RepID=UPI001E1C440C|nr:sperm-associated antigen 1 isoform X2 [Coregonus clupeaformis]